MNNLISILMERDEISRAEAIELIIETRDEILDAELVEADDILMENLGLEPDFMVELLTFKTNK